MAYEIAPEKRNIKVTWTQNGEPYWAWYERSGSAAKFYLKLQKEPNTVQDLEFFEKEAGRWVQRSDEYIKTFLLPDDAQKTDL